MEGYTKKRPVVGFMTGNFHHEHPKLLVSALWKHLKNMDIDLHMYLGSDPSAFMGDYVTKDVGFDHHYYSLYSYSHFEDLDLLVIGFGGLTMPQDPIRITDFVSRIPDIPIILLGNAGKIPDTVHILIDNYHGQKQAICHLIEEHGCERIVYVSGPKGNDDAEKRRKAYEDALKEHGIPIREELIVQGNFSNRVDSLIEECLKHTGKPDAVVAANDSMAESAYRVIQKMGWKVGEDVAVTGFDNLPATRFFQPALTTVTQDYEKLGLEIAGQVKRFLSGEGFSDVLIPAHLVERQSCGCRADKDKAALERLWEEDRRNILRGQAQIQNNQIRFMLCSLVLRNLLMQSVNMESFLRKLGEQLALVGTKSSYLCLLDEPLRLLSNEMVVPPEARLFLCQKGSDVCVYKKEEAPVIGRRGLRRYIESEESSRFADFILFYQENQYGMLCVEIDPDDVLFYHTLSLEIGSGLRYLQIALEEKAARDSLAEKNQILDYTASHDELTGLYNRAGVMSRIFPYIREHGEMGRFVAVMADLDHLKQINDTFGHGEGDSAIQTAADVLRAAMPKGSPIGRSGGDEFTGVFFLDSSKDEETFLRTIKRSCEAYNLSSGKPYYVGISVGCRKFEAGEEKDILAVLKDADRALYQAKKSRRKSVLREEGVS